MTPIIPDAPVRERTIEIRLGSRSPRGTLAMPEAPLGVVAFAHGSGSSRFSPRNRFVAQALRNAGFATLLMDLLEDDESADRRKVFDIELLSERFQVAAGWLGRDPETRDLPLGYFGASTGAAAALVAAARRPERVRAVVSRGGRPDLARAELPRVQAPTLLIVGSRDEEVLELNRQALALMPCRRELAVVPGATHLFPEPGALEVVARRAAEWFRRHAALESSHRADPPEDPFLSPFLAS